MREPKPAWARGRYPAVLTRIATQLLWPARCAACAAFVAADQIFCASCRVSAVPMGSACPGCALPFGADPPAATRCPGCRESPFPFARAYAAMAYGGAISKAILRLKHGRQRHLVRPLGALLGPILAAASASGIDCLCPVPLHPRRLRERGFNQALELLRAARRAQGAQGAQAVVLCDGLRRVRDTPALGREAPASRRRVLAGAFAASPRVKGRRILLVDDVMTTGATSAECARVLGEAGAAEVQVAALARAL
jgi:ComF family protein